MNLEGIRDYCLQKKGVTESFPFDEDTLVFKVMGKIFLLLNLSDAHSMNLKCDPDWALELREKHLEVQPGYHMNKRHWNTVALHGLLSTQQLTELIDHSYALVVAKLSKIQQKALTH